MEGNRNGFPLITMFASSMQDVNITFWRYPLWWLSVALLGGFLIGHHFPFPLSWWWITLLLALCGQVIFYRSVHFGWFFLLFGVFAGTGIHFWSFDYPMACLREWERRMVSVQGCVIKKGDSYFLTRLRGFPIYSPSLLLRGEEWEPLLYERVELQGILRPFPSCVNPGGRDLRLLWWKKRVMGFLEVKRRDVRSASSLWYALLRAVHEKREAFLATWEDELREHSFLLRALLFGDKNDQFRRESTLFERMGVYHLFCVSGFHLALLGGMLFTIIERFFFLKRFAWLILLLFSFGYLLFCGLVPSAVRAWIMLGVWLWRKHVGRNVVPVSALLVALLAMFLAQPEVVFDGGAQLSFASTAGILLLFPLWERERRKGSALLVHTRRALFLGIAVYTFAFPFLLGNRLSFSSHFLLGNVVVLPLVEGILFSLFGGLPVMFFPWGRFLFASWLRMSCRVLLTVMQFFSTSLPVLFLDFSKLSDFRLGVVIFSGFVVGSFFMVMKDRKKTILVALLVGVLLVGGLVFVPPREAFWIFDVGQGLACALLAGDTAWFIDVGGTIRGYGLVGKSILQPFLLHRGIREVERIFLTHWHQDHAGGLEAFREHLAPRTIFAPQAISSETRILFIPLASYGKFTMTPHLTVTAFPIFGFTPNDGAVVYLIEGEGMKILVTGDIEEAGIASLLEYGQAIRADVVVLPHHGKYYSRLKDLFTVTGCHTVVVSCGENPYGHPDKRTLALAQAMGLRTYVTQDHGAVEIPLGKKIKKVKALGKRKF